MTFTHTRTQAHTHTHHGEAKTAQDTEKRSVHDVFFLEERMDSVALASRLIDLCFICVPSCKLGFKGVLCPLFVNLDLIRRHP